jgi:hypothetical protein
MFPRIRTTLTPTRAHSWDRRRLLLAFGTAVAVAAALLVGLAYAIVSIPTRHHYAGRASDNTGTATGLGNLRPVAASSPPPSALAASTLAAALAADPMTAARPDAAEPGPVSVRDPGTLVLPAATAMGPAHVPTGFAHTPAGALAQLAALDQVAMQTATVPGVRATITAWTVPGGRAAGTGSAVAAMAALLTAAQLSGGGSPQLALTVTPLMGLIKGSVGADLSVVCVDFEFDATFNQTSRVADADCQTMIWNGDRWRIGPGPQPAQPASVWPDTDAAITAGYADLSDG